MANANKQVREVITLELTVEEAAALRAAADHFDWARTQEVRNSPGTMANITKDSARALKGIAGVLGGILKHEQSEAAWDYVEMRREAGEPRKADEDDEDDD